MCTMAAGASCMYGSDLPVRSSLLRAPLPVSVSLRLRPPLEEAAALPVTCVQVQQTTSTLSSKRHWTNNLGESVFWRSGLSTLEQDDSEGCVSRGIRLWRPAVLAGGGVQSRPPQNTLVWHINYFELKALGSGRSKETRFFLKAQEKLPCKSALPVAGGRHSYRQKWGVEAQGNLNKPNCQTNPYVPSHCLTTTCPSPNPSVWPHLHNYDPLSNLVQRCLALTASSGLHFSCEVSFVHANITK